MIARLKVFPRILRYGLIGGIFGLPLVLLASIFWLRGDDYLGFGYHVGEKVYSLGYPLTGLMHWYVGRYGILSSADDIWAIPAMNLLFLLQWCIWGMLIGAIVTVICRGKQNV